MSDAGKIHRVITSFSYRARLLMVVSLTVVLVLLLYGRVWNDGFVQDDYTWLEISARSNQFPPDLFSLHISGFFRPLVHALFSVNYAVFGLDPCGYNATNIAIEICCTLVLIWVLARLTSSWAGALVGAILFTTHPSHGEAVGWICARTASLVALMSLLTIASWIQWRETRRRRWWMLAFGAYCLALMTKEEAAVLLPIVLIMDVVLLGQRHGTIRQSANRLWHDRKVILLFVTALGAYLLLQVHFQSQSRLVRHGEYLWHPGAIVNNLNHLAVLFISKGVARPPWLQVTFLVEVILATALLCYSRNRESRVAAVGLAIAMIALLPASFFKEHFGARYYYVPSIGSALVWASIVSAFTRAKGGQVLRILRASCATLVVVAILTQAYRLDHKLDFWTTLGRQNAAYLQATQRVAPLLQNARDTNDTVCVLDSPLTSPNMKSLLWLVGGPEPKRVIVALPGSLPDGATECNLILQWCEHTQTLKPVIEQCTEAEQ